MKEISLVKQYIIVISSVYISEYTLQTKAQLHLSWANAWAKIQELLYDMKFRNKNYADLYCSAI